ncbi:MAG: cupin domain-containing protein [Leptospiraceae bacterium]|nr:cupin domain-containing protein [Leptospiraceae bacterium]
MNLQEQIDYWSMKGYGDFYVWEDSPGTYYDWHTHPFDELRVVLKGSILIGTEEGQVLLKQGDYLEVPSNTRHWARTETGVSYLCGTKRNY